MKHHINFCTKFKKNSHMTSSFQRTLRYNASENNLIKNFDIVDLSFMKTNYTHCLYWWTTSDFC